MFQIVPLLGAVTVIILKSTKKKILHQIMMVR